MLLSQCSFCRKTQKCKTIPAALQGYTRLMGIRFAGIWSWNQISWQSLRLLSRYFTQSINIRIVRGSTKWVGSTLWGPWISVPNFTVISPTVVETFWKKPKMSTLWCHKRKIRGSPKSLRLIVWGPWMSVQTFVAIHLMVILVWTTVVDWKTYTAIHRKRFVSIHKQSHQANSVIHVQKNRAQYICSEWLLLLI